MRPIRPVVPFRYDGPDRVGAPDTNYFNGRVHLYYGASVWGQQHTAVMGLATAANIEGGRTRARAPT